MATKYILAALSAVFLILGLIRLGAGGGKAQQSRTWLLIGFIFAAVSGWLFYQT